jgi:hypothetical protein
MKSAFSLLSAALIAMSLTSCLSKLLKDQKVELVQIKIGNDYSMNIPSFMSKTTRLNEEASLQFQNMFEEAYVIVIDENKQEFIDVYRELDAYDTLLSPVANYADTQIQLTSSNMEVTSKNELKSYQINGLNAASIEIDAKVDNTAITYFLTFVEGPDKLYMIMAWTLQNKKDEHRKTFDEMAKSFSVLRAQPVAIQ